MNLDSGEPLDSLTPACIEWCRSIGSSAKTIQDILVGPDANIMRAIQEGIDRANKLAPSNAQRIQKWTILPRDFSVPGGELGKYTLHAIIILQHMYKLCVYFSLGKEWKCKLSIRNI